MSELIYGKNAINETLKGERIIKVYLTNNSPYLKQVKEAKLNYEIKDKHFLDKLTKGGRHQGIAAEIKEYETYNYKELLKKENGLLVILDGLTDPHNLGAIMRSVDCIGADGIIYSKNRSVKLNSTVAKVASGAAEYVKVTEVNNLVNTIKDLKKQNYWIVACDAGGDMRYDQLDCDRNLAIIIGAEGKGLSRLVKEECDYIVSLPMLGHLDSLNASVAAGIVLYRIYTKRFPQ